jgi:hypothetical protein
VRSAGNAPVQATQTIGFEFQPYPPVTITALTASKPSPQPVNTQVTFTTSATGGDAPLQYRYYKRNTSTPTWTLTSDWSTSTTWNLWGSEGMWEVKAQARSAGNAPVQAEQVIGFVFAVPSTVTDFSADHASPIPIGLTTTWVTTVTGGTLPPEFQFERRDGEVWSVVQPYSPASQYSWTPSAPDVGDHQLRVLVRGSGSAEAFESTATVTFSVQ